MIQKAFRIYVGLSMLLACSTFLAMNNSNDAIAQQCEAIASDNWSILTMPSQSGFKLHAGVALSSSRDDANQTIKSLQSIIERHLITIGRSDITVVVDEDWLDI